MIEKSERERLIRENELARLRDWLSRAFWTRSQAVYLLAGVTPDTYEHPQDGWWLEFLPGGRRINWLSQDASHGREILGRHLENELERTRDLASGERKKSPKDWILYSMKWEYTPVWLTIAQDDSECRNFVPLGNSNEKSKSRDESCSPQRKGGLAKAKNSIGDRVKTKIRETFLEWHSNPAAYESRELFSADMKRKYHEFEAPLSKEDSDYNDEHPLLRTRKTIKKYVDQLIEEHGLPPGLK